MSIWSPRKLQMQSLRKETWSFKIGNSGSLMQNQNPPYLRAETEIPPHLREATHHLHRKLNPQPKGQQSVHGLQSLREIPRLLCPTRGYVRVNLVSISIQKPSLNQGHRVEWSRKNVQRKDHLLLPERPRPHPKVVLLQNKQVLSGRWIAGLHRARTRTRNLRNLDRKDYTNNCSVSEGHSLYRWKALCAPVLCPVILNYVPCPKSEIISCTSRWY